MLERAVRVTGQSWDRTASGERERRERERERERERDDDDEITRFEMNAPSMSTLPIVFNASSGHGHQRRSGRRRAWEGQKREET